METPPGAEKKRKRRLEEVTTDVQRLALAVPLPSYLALPPAHRGAAARGAS